MYLNVVYCVNTGDKGDPGPRGLTHSQAMKGEKGNDGLPGPMGLKGEQGNECTDILTNYIVVKHIY